MITDFQDSSEGLLLKLGNEVRHALHNVMGWIELTAEEPLSETQLRRLAQCRDSADRLLGISNDVVELVAPFKPVAAGAFELQTMVEEVAEITRLLASRKDLEFHSSVDPAAPLWVVADREAIQDMLRRILDNGIRFTGAGLVTLIVKVSLVSGDLPSGNKATVVFDIFDTGPGIPTEVLNASARLAESHPCEALGWKLCAAALWR